MAGDQIYGHVSWNKRTHRSDREDNRAVCSLPKIHYAETHKTTLNCVLNSTT